MKLVRGFILDLYLLENKKKLQEAGILFLLYNTDTQKICSISCPMNFTLMKLLMETNTAGLDKKKLVGFSVELWIESLLVLDQYSYNSNILNIIISNLPNRSISFGSHSMNPMEWFGCIKELQDHLLDNDYISKFYVYDFDLKKINKPINYFLNNFIF